MEKGHWLKVDAHLHSTFSDGAHTIDELAAQAVKYGCDVIAITDHADRDRNAASADFAEAISAARRQHPNLLIVAGLEWNLPPWGCDEHATLLMPRGDNEFLNLAEFKAQFDDHQREPHDAQLAIDALNWLNRLAESGDGPPIVFYNHPNRKKRATAPQRSTEC